jgi:hypothetical protein
MATPDASPPTPAPSPKSRTLLGVVLVVLVVIIVAVAGLYVAKVGPFATQKAAAGPTVEGGFAQGQVVTFQFTGNYECTPSLASFFPSESSVSSTTNCEVGMANQNAVQQVPEWVLVPAFAGLSAFGLSSLGANSRGFPVYSSAAVLTDCGAGGSPTGCPDHPTYLYSPSFTAVEQFTNASSGYGGLPEGVLPTPAHDGLLNISGAYPNVEWGMIVVLVFDPNIFPDRATGGCTAVTPSNLASATGNCLTSIAALDRALTTTSSSVTTVNGGSPGNPVWKALAGNGLQILIPGDVSVTQVNNLNANLYVPFSVGTGAPSSFPS